MRLFWTRLEIGCGAGEGDAAELPKNTRSDRTASHTISCLHTNAPVVSLTLIGLESSLTFFLIAHLA